MSGEEVSLPAIVPPVTEADILEIEAGLKCRFDQARRSVLLSNESFDVQACPGSGKTTLLIAKLAILAKKWTHARRGICVLSHTNVAREEVEIQLAGSSAGQRLLAPPHFIGTIHSFVNEFLALPLLRSKGHGVRLIDDEASGEVCKRLLYGVSTYSTAKAFLAKKDAHDPDRTIRSLRYEGDQMTLGCAAGSMPCGAGAASFEQLRAIKDRAAAGGIWRHDDMFAWADMLLAQHPESAVYAQWRFPVVFLDEMQDTSEMQSGVLARVFPVNKCALRQRFGDVNQAIYDYGQSTSTTDPFPGANHRTVANSLRFGPSIAKKAEPFGPLKFKGGLVGEGPTRDIACAPSPPSCHHTMFVFSDTTAANVLPAFGRLLLATFPDSAIAEGWFRARAIGRIGAASDKNDKKPRSVGDYWAEYQPKVSKLNARPEKLAGYLHLARRRHGDGRDCAEAVRTAVRGLIELMDLVGRGVQADRGHGLRMLRQEMANQPEAIHALEQGLWRWCVAPGALTEQVWPRELESVRSVMRAMVGEEWNSRADAFCEWSTEFQSDVGAVEPSSESAINRYVLRDGARQVEIGLGTVHGAKGQTHTATLVLETHFKKHDLGDLLSCLGAPSKAVGKNPGVERLERMRILYTAMTRPTHLLCVAIRAEALTQDPGSAKNTEQLRASGWTITELG